MLLLCGDLAHEKPEQLGAGIVHFLTRPDPWLRPLACTLGLQLPWGPPVRFLWHPTGQACMERRVNISIWNAEDRLAFVLHQALCQQNSPR